MRSKVRKYFLKKQKISGSYPGKRRRVFWAKEKASTEDNGKGGESMLQRIEKRPG